MQKIPVLFKFNEEHKVIPELNPKAAWVLEEPVIAHRKYDGTCMFFDGYQWFVRREVKPQSEPPKDFTLVEIDPNTGKQFGWIPGESSSFRKFFDEALLYPPMDCDIIDQRSGMYESGTYELIGPKINANPEKLKKHRLMPHARAEQLGDIQILELDLAQDVEEVYAQLKQELYHLPIEGIIFKDLAMHKMAKLRRKDFDYRAEEIEDIRQKSY